MWHIWHRFFFWSCIVCHQMWTQNFRNNDVIKFQLSAANCGATSSVLLSASIHVSDLTGKLASLLASTTLKSRNTMNSTETLSWNISLWTKVFSGRWCVAKSDSAGAVFKCLNSPVSVQICWQTDRLTDALLSTHPISPPSTELLQRSLRLISA